MAVRLLVVALALPLAAGAAEARRGDGRLVNAIVAIVNNEPVTKAEVDDLVRDYLRDAEQVTPEQYRAQWKRFREAIVEQKLLVQEARRRDIRVEPKEVDEQIARYKELGVDMTDRRDWVREQLMATHLLMRLTSARSITPRQVAEYYEKHRDEFVLRERRHVFVIAVNASSFGGNKAAAKQLAEGIRAQLKQGEDFAALARKHSDGAFADKGGDYGWFEKGALFGAIDQVAFRLKAGEVGGPIETDDGYLIVKVAGIQPAGLQSLPEARETIRQRLQAEHRKERQSQLVGQLKRSASILRIDLEAVAEP